MTTTSNGTSGYWTGNGWVTFTIASDPVGPRAVGPPTVVHRPLPSPDRPRVLPSGRAIILPDECAPDTGVD